MQCLLSAPWTSGASAEWVTDGHPWGGAESAKSRVGTGHSASGKVRNRQAFTGSQDGCAAFGMRRGCPPGSGSRKGVLVRFEALEACGHQYYVYASSQPRRWRLIERFPNPEVS